MKRDFVIPSVARDPFRVTEGLRKGSFVVGLLRMTREAHP